MENSSPPKRAARPFSRSAPAVRCPNGLQQHVASVMAKRVVHVLEMIEIHIIHPKGLSPRRDAASARPSRLRNVARLGSPVSPCVPGEQSHLALVPLAVAKVKQ
jgi:hypothetical protein